MLAPYSLVCGYPALPPLLLRPSSLSSFVDLLRVVLGDSGHLLFWLFAQILLMSAWGHVVLPSPWLELSLLLRVLFPPSLLLLGPRSLMCPRSVVVYRLCAELFPSPPFPSLCWLLLLLLPAAFCVLLVRAYQVLIEALAPLLAVGVVRLGALLAF